VVRSGVTGRREPSDLKIPFIHPAVTESRDPNGDVSLARPVRLADTQIGLASLEIGETQDATPGVVQVLLCC
jgi:hypothetical protein